MPLLELKGLNLFQHDSVSVHKVSIMKNTVWTEGTQVSCTEPELQPHRTALG